MTASEAARKVASLRKARNLEQAIELGRETLRQWPDDRGLRQAVGWCLWERVNGLVRSGLDDATWTEVMRYLTAASRWAKDAAGLGSYNSFDPLPLMLTTVLRATKAQQQPRRLLQAAELAEPALLPGTRDGDFASHRMMWLSLTTWALAEMEDWSALLQLEQQRIPIPKEKESEWVNYRFALAHEASGDAEGALELFDRAFPAMSAPWQRVARARILQTMGRSEDSALEARRALAASQRDDLLMAIDAIHLLARTLATVDRDRAIAHAAIAVAVRQEHGYGVDAKLRKTCEILRIADVDAADGEVFREQSSWWKAADEAARLTGQVSRHLANGGSGFIAGDDGREYYFAKKRADTRPLLPVGTRVTFEAVSSFDAKKNAPSIKAIRVRRA